VSALPKELSVVPDFLIRSAFHVLLYHLAGPLRWL
jgi:hypothetical protein